MGKSADWTSGSEEGADEGSSFDQGQGGTQPRPVSKATLVFPQMTSAIRLQDLVHKANGQHPALARNGGWRRRLSAHAARRRSCSVPDRRATASCLSCKNGSILGSGTCRRHEF